MSLAVGALLLALHSFGELAATLHDGHEVRAVFDYHACTLVSEKGDIGEPGPEAIGGMALRSWELFAPGVVHNPQAFVAASETHLIRHPTRGFVQNYVKVKVFADDSVEVNAAYLDPKSLRVVMDETFRCTIDHGASFYVEGPG